MSHLSNNTQELHDSVQPSLSHTVDGEACYNDRITDKKILGQALHRFDTESTKKLVQTIAMGNSTNKEKIVNSHNDIDNEFSSNHLIENESTHFACEKIIPTVVVSDTSPPSENHVLNGQESTSSEEHCSESGPGQITAFNHVTNVASVGEELKETITGGLESCLTPSNLSDNLDPEEAVDQVKRDSAYGSSSESGNLATPPSNPISSIDFVSDKAHGDRSENNQTQAKGLTKSPLSDSALFSTALANKWSSTSSLASDSLTETPVLLHDSECCSGLVLNKDLRHLSSSNFSLRSSLSLESEDETINVDDSTQRPKLNRRDSQVKAQRSWKKIRQMVAWSPFMQSFKKKYPWVQLAGHAGNFQPGEEGCILKKYVEREAECLKELTSDESLRIFAPTFHGIVYLSDEKYTRMQDLLLPFDNPSLMDCKMGIRTYLENELIQAREKPRLRQDMYKKMVEISPDEPTEQERKQKAVTKPRYMQWREQVSSTSNLGFRIEGIKKSFRDPSKDYKLTKTAAQVTEAFKYFIDNNVSVLEKYIERLKALCGALEVSDFFHSHEAIGSSLLFVHDDTGLANVWMIDFGKTSRLPGQQKVDHRSEWVEGNREDGYLFGVDNMIQLFENILEDLKSQTSAFSLISSDKETKEVHTLPKVDIIVTAPSPTSARKQALRRQEAKTLPDEFHSDHVIGVDVTSFTS